MNVHPLIFQPIYKPKIWGGDKIFTHFGRPAVGSEPVGESWELADLEEDASRVSVGPAAGKKLAELVAAWGTDLIGQASLFEGRFPLLIKFLDARASLSVQVHPTAAVALKLGGNVRVKHEAWYILAAEPDGAIYHGLEPGLTPELFREAMVTGQVQGVLRRIPVKQGDCYYLPSGTVHALGAGVLVAEVQTPSDITYRTYDWGRVVPQTGQPRELHLDQAIECIDFDAPSPPAMQVPSCSVSPSATVTSLVRCDSFTIDDVQVPAGASNRLPAGEMFVWIVLEGSGTIHYGPSADPTEFCPGNVVLLPAALPEATVKAASASRWLEVGVPA